MLADVRRLERAGFLLVDDGDAMAAIDQHARQRLQRLEMAVEGGRDDGIVTQSRPSRPRSGARLSAARSALPVQKQAMRS